MDPRLPDRLEELLTRAFDGELTPSERGELDALALLEPRLADLAELRAALRAALAVPGPVDVAADVMAILAEDAAWSLGDDLRHAVAAPVDFADAIMGAVSVPPAEEEWALGADLRRAVATPVDLADAVMAGIADAEWELGADLRGALDARVDVADAVMAALAEDAAWNLGPALREAVAGPVDIADAVLAAVDPACELMAYADGELAPARAAAVEARLLHDAGAREQLAAFAATGEALRGATARTGDLWAGIADGIGAERDAVHGWDDVAGSIRAAFATIPPVDVRDAVMAAVQPRVRAVADTLHERKAPRMPAWASLGGPLLAFAAAATLLFAILPEAPPQGVIAEVEINGMRDIRLATVNDARVEEVSAPNDAVVQVMQFEEGGVTFILVEDSPRPGVPL